MKKLLALLALCLPLAAQQTTARWYATTGNVSQSGATYTATIQQPATNQSQVAIDQIIVYCSVTCTVTQSANGTAASSTANTVGPLLPTPLNVPINLTFWTASNVGAGTQQGGIANIAGPGTAILCLGTSCGNAGQITLPAGMVSNYSVTISAITGTSNIAYYGRISQ